MGPGMLGQAEAFRVIKRAKFMHIIHKYLRIFKDEFTGNECIGI